MITTKEQLFGQLKPKTLDFMLDSGEAVQLHELSLAQRGELAASAQDDPIKSQAIIVTMACPLLTDGDIDALMMLPGGEIAEMADKILEISGLSTPPEDEDAEKNSSSGPSASSDTASP